MMKNQTRSLFGSKYIMVNIPARGSGRTHVAAILLLMTAMITVVHPQQDTSYRVSKSLNNDDGFDVKLTCQNHLGISATNAEFYRNGADSNTDACLNEFVYNTSSDGSSIDFKSSSECDGYYMCGVTSNNNYILSGPLAVYTEPVETGNGEQNIQIEEGQSTTLQCKISSSPINQYTTHWHRLLQADDNIIETITTEDNSLHLENVTLSEHQGTYYCQVVTNLPKQGISVTSLTNGNTKLQIFEKFDPPRFIRNLTYSRVNSDEQAIFNTLAADNVHYPVSYRWEINGTVVPDSTSEELSMDIGYGRTKVRVTIWNTNYNGEEYSQSQTVYVNREIQQQPLRNFNCTPALTEEVSVKEINLSNAEFIGIIFGVIVAVALLVGIIVSIVVFLIMKQRYVPKPNPEATRVQVDESGLVPVHSFSTQPSQSSFTNGNSTDQLVGLLNSCSNLVRQQLKSKRVRVEKIIFNFVVSFMDGIQEDEWNEDVMLAYLDEIKSLVTMPRYVQTDDNNTTAAADNIRVDGKLENREKEISETKLSDEADLRKIISQKVEDIKSRMNEQTINHQCL